MTIHRWTVSKTIPVIKKDRIVRYDLAECLDALKRFKVKEIRTRA